MIASGSCGATVTWELGDDGTLTISGAGKMADYTDATAPWYSYHADIKTVVIADGVTSIGDYVFNNCASLTSITIPDSVTSIGAYAFRLCFKLTSITMPDSVTSIGNGAFYNCTSLTSITIPDSVTSVGKDAFFFCTSLTSVKIGNGMTSIGQSAFRNCSSLTSITIPDSVTSIGSYVFHNCASLTSITIPESVTSIDTYAFASCTSLTSITIPDSVTSIDTYAFANCTSLTSIEVESNNTVYSAQDGVLFNKDKTELLQYPIGNSRTSYTVPDSVTSIGQSAFRNCTNLTSITIPDSVTSIDTYAFDNCASLTSIEVASNNTVYSSQDGVLFNKDKTKLIQCPRGNSRTSYTVPDSVTSIMDYAFKYCANLTSITIPGSVTRIRAYAFSDCSKLIDVYYVGDETDWSAISITSYGNTCLTSATRHYIQKCIVIFVDWDSTVLKTQTVNYGSAATAPDVLPTREHYTFTGWDIDFSSIAADTTVTAQYTINVYEDVKESQLYQNVNGYIRYADSTYNNNGPIDSASTNALAIFTVNPGETYRVGLHMLTRFRVGTLDALVNKTVVQNLWIADGDINGTTVIDEDRIYEIAIPDGMNYLIVGYWAGSAGQWTDTWDSLTIEKVNGEQAIPNAITVTPPTKLLYDIGEQLDTTGMVVTLQYSDGTETAVTSDYTISGFDAAQNGVQTITVNYCGFTDTFTVTVTGTINTYTVTFVDWDGTVLKTQTVNYGSAATAPYPPTHNGYKFFAWDISFDYVIADMDITAIYRKQNPPANVMIYSASGSELGSIRKAKSASITRKLSGECTFEITTSTQAVSFIHIDHRLEVDGLIFNITEIKKQTQNGAYFTTIQGEHVSYVLNNDEYKITEFDFTGSPSSCLAQLLSGTPFHVGTIDFTQDITLKINKDCTRRSAVMQLVALCGGELDYDGYNINIVSHVGKTDVIELMPTENVTDLAVSTSADGTVTYDVTLFRRMMIELGSELHILFKPFSIDERNRIVGLTWNPYNFRSISVTVGTYQATLMDLYEVKESIVSDSGSSDAGGGDSDGDGSSGGGGSGGTYTGFDVVSCTELPENPSNNTIYLIQGTVVTS